MSKNQFASAGQRLLWAFERNSVSSGTLNIPTVLRIQQVLNESALKKAIETVIKRHESLRTKIRWQAPKLYQDISSKWLPEIQKIDLSEDQNNIEKLNELLSLELKTPIASSDMPVRVKLFALSKTDHVLCLNIHHMAVDYVSTNIIVHELATLYLSYSEYGSQAELQQIDWQYQQWVEWQNSQLEERFQNRHIKYWHKQLEGAKAPCFSQNSGELTPDRQVAFEAVMLNEKSFSQMESMVVSERATLFTIMLAVFYMAISRLTSQTDLTVTTLLSDRLKPEIDGTVGYFISPVALRTKFSLTDSVINLVQSCRDTLFGAFKHQHIPLHMLPWQVNKEGEARLDDVVLQMMGDPVDLPYPFKAWDIHSDINGGRTFNLEIVVRPISGNWYVTALYSQQNYSSSFVKQLISHFSNVLDVAMQDPNQSLESVFQHPLLS